MTTKIGTIILDHYKLLEELGYGQRGTVFLAINQESRELKAIKAIKLHDKKLISPLNQQIRQLNQRFADIHHPQIIIPEVCGFDGNQNLLCLVMPYLAGWNLQEYSRQKGSLTIPQALSIIKQIAKVLDLLHSRGFVHGDLKPSNIMVLAEDKIALSDVGLYAVFRLLGSASGIPFYTAPESFENSSAKPQPNVDIYALGVIMFELLTARRPFESDSSAELRQKYQQNIAPPSLSLYAPDISHQLDDLVEKCLWTKVNQRYQRGKEIAQQIESILQPLNKTSPTEPNDNLANIAPEVMGDAPAALINILQKEQVYTLYPLKNIYIVGRRTEQNSEVDVDLSDDQTVSRLNSRIYYQQGKWTIRDISGKNKTQLNNKTVPADHEIPLKDGDVCQFGKRTKLIFKVGKKL